MLLERKKKREKEKNFVKMKEIKEREREGEIGEKLEKLDVLGTRGCVLEVVLLRKRRASCVCACKSKLFCDIKRILLRRNNLHKYAQISNSFFFYELNFLSLSFSRARVDNI